MNSSVRQNTIFSIIILPIIILRCAIELMPVVSLFTNQIINIGSLLILYAAVVFGRKLDSNDWKYCIMVCAVLLLDTIFAFFRDEGIIVKIYVCIQSCIWPLLGIYVVRKFSLKQNRIMIYSVFAISLITMITTYLGCISNPGITRHLATPDSVDDGLQQMASAFNVGGFKFVYQSILLTPVAILLFKRGGFANIVLSITLLLFMLLYVIETNYTTATVVFLVSLLLFTTPNEYKPYFMLKRIMFVILLFIIFRSFIAEIFLIIAQKLGENDISVRLQEVGNLLLGSSLEETEDSMSRVESWVKSLSFFSENILWGSKDIGGHSYVLDSLALYGVFGILALFLSFKGIHYCLVKTQQNKEFYGYCIFIYFINIALCIVNTVNFIFITTFFYPLLFHYLNCKNSSNIDVGAD